MVDHGRSAVSSVASMRVHVVDPSAYTPPYDHALCAALAGAGAQVELITSRFPYGLAPAPEGYERRELFYALSHRRAASGPRSRGELALKAAEHVPQMARYRRLAQSADVVHFQWLPVQPLDVHLLPRARATAAGPRPQLVLTAHDVLPREPRAGQLSAQRRLYERVDAIVVHSERGRERLTGELALDPARVHVIPHGVLRPWEDAPEPPAPPPADRRPAGDAELAGEEELPAELRGVDGPVVLFFGLLRPYKGIDLLLEAWRGIEGAELWIVGMARMETAPLHATAPPGVRFVERFVSDREAHALMRRASLAVLPYREIDQSGVAFTALGAGTPLLASDIGGFPELAESGAAQTFAAGDAAALHSALTRLLGDHTALEQMAAGALAAGARGGRYSWDEVARTHMALYRQLLEGSSRP